MPKYLGGNGGAAAVYNSDQIINVSGVPGANVSNALDVLAAAIVNSVPQSRVVNATSPLQVNGGASADLSADITLSVLDVTNTHSGTVPAVGAAGTVPVSSGAAAVWGNDVSPQVWTAGGFTTTGVSTLAGNLLLGTGTRSVLGNIKLPNVYQAFARNSALTGDQMVWQVSGDTVTIGNFLLNSGSAAWELQSLGSLARLWIGTNQRLTVSNTVITTTCIQINLNAGATNTAIQIGGVPVLGFVGTANRNMSIWGDGTQNFASGERIVALVNRIAEPIAGVAGHCFFYAQAGNFTTVTSAGDKIEWTSAQTATATAGAAGALPVLPLFYLSGKFNGTSGKIPVYAP